MTTLSNVNRPQGGRKVQPTLLIATLLAAMTSPSAVLASDDKVYSGAGCQPEQGPNITQFAYPYGGIYNQGQTWQTVNCLIVRDNTTNTNGVTVTVRFDPGVEAAYQSWAGLGCGVWAFDQTTHPPYNTAKLPPYGGILVSQQYPSNLEVGVVNILTIHQPHSFSRGHYVLYCQLPPSAGVVSYWVSEP